MSGCAGRPAWCGSPGEGAETIEDDTKSSKPRVVDVDAETVAVWKTHRKARGSMALQLHHRQDS